MKIFTITLILVTTLLLATLIAISDNGTELVQATDETLVNITNNVTQEILPWEEPKGNNTTASLFIKNTMHIVAYATLKEVHNAYGLITTTAISNPEGAATIAKTIMIIVTVYLLVLLLTPMIMIYMIIDEYRMERRKKK